LLDIASRLDETNFGILCVTPEAAQSAWLNFEAGALGKKVKEPFTGVVGLLFGMKPGGLRGPITQFQNVEFSKPGVKRLVQDINKRLTVPVEEHRLEKLFETFWSELADFYEKNKQRKSAVIAPKTDREILDEILARIRNHEQLLNRFFPKPVEEIPRF
jgi:hypothetical protein